MSYLLLKYLHVSCVALSGLGFLLRGSWMLLDSPRLQGRWVRILPHVVDSLLLLSALALIGLSRQYPFVQPWLTAKFFGLLLYILLGTVALKRGRTYAMRALAFALALLTFAYIVSVALTRNPYLLW